ncbi:DUF6247 family protein [Actinomycetospora atypica]|uniref:DUF6247 family protein n=1 Tax=Actinomycetospora atypica TaxID=1290095 RepID=A0ABV9YNH9_9PSEU
MADATRVRRTGPAIRAALLAVSPEECATFEAELGAALDRAAVQEVLDRWWGTAAIRVNPLDPEEQAQLTRARSGDLFGLWEQDEPGAWSQH